MDNHTYEMFKPESKPDPNKSKGLGKQKNAKEIMEWAIRKQKAHDQMVLTRMMYGYDKDK